MSIRNIAIAAVLVLVSFYALNYDGGVHKAHAQIIPTYDFEYNATTLYSAFYLEYEISGLNSSLSHSWTVYRVNPETGGTTTPIGRIDQPAGVTSTTWQFGVGDGNPQWPDNFSGPIRVVDNNGATLGRHYVAETPAGDWFSGGGNQDIYDMLVMSNENLANSSCPSVVHNDINGDGWIHGFEACQSTIETGGYALLHYQINYLSFVTSTIETTAISQLGLGSVDPIATVDVVDLIDWQTTDGYAGVADLFAYRSFMVVNFGDDELPFMDYEYADNIFGSGYGTNPLRVGEYSGLGTNTKSGVFSCATFSGVSVVEECESILLVSESPNLREWELSGIDQVQDGGENSYTIRQHTFEIWLSYSKAMDLVDSEVGAIDSTIYTYEGRSTGATEGIDQRVGTYTVTSTPTENVVLSYTVEPRTLITGVTAATDEMAFAVTFTYDVVDVVSIEEAFSGLVESSGFNTPAGRTFIHGAIIAIFLAMVAAVPLLRGIPIVWALTWTLSGSLPAMIDATHSDLSNLLWLLGGIVFWLFAISNMRRSSDMGMQS